MPYIGRNHIAGDHTSNFKVLDDISSYTATFDGSSTNVVSTTNETLRILEHRFIQGQRVTYTNGGGGNIGGLTTGTAYFVTFDTHNTIKLATSLSNANNNINVNLSSVGSGTAHTLNAAFDGTNTKFKLTHNSGDDAIINNATQLQVAINNVIQRPNQTALSFTEGFAIEDSHKIVFKTAPTSNDVFWGSIIANTIESFDSSDFKVDNFTGDGSTTSFTLSKDVPNLQSLMITLDGVTQHASDNTTTRSYSLTTSNTVEFTAAPGVGIEIQVKHLGFAGAATGEVSGFYGRTGNVTLSASDHIVTGDITSRNTKATGISTVVNLDVDDFIDVGSNIKLGYAGVITATSFSGSGAGLTGIDATAIKDSGGNVKIQAEASGAVYTGIHTFSGNVSIGGTLTYEDVTNIDSVGIITARNGIDCNGDLDVDGHTNLDNVSIAGVTTIASNTTIGGNLTVNGTNTNLNTTTYVKGGEGAAGILAIYADEGDDNADKFRFISDTDGTLKLDNYAGGSWETNIKAVGNAGVHLYNNNVEVAYTNNQGLYITNTGAAPVLRLLSPSGYDARIDLTADTHANEDNYRIEVNTDQKFRVYGKPGGNYTSFIELDQAGQVTLTRDLDVARHLDVDGHTNLDNVSIAGVTTFAGAIDLNADLDVDGHTNLDNVSIAGVTTFSGNANFGSNGSITTSADFALSSNQLRVTGGSTVVGEFKGTSIPTVQVTQTTNNTDLQLRANSEGGLVRTATNFPLILGAYQKEKLRIDGGSYARIGINTSTFDTAGAQLKIEGRGTGTTSPPYLQIKGVGSGVLHSYVDLIATSDNNAGSAYRGLGVVMLDEPTDVEWFSGRPYAGSDKYIIGRKASPSYRTQSGELANSLLQIDSSGNLMIGSNSAEAKLDVTGGVSISSNGVTVSPSGYDLKIRSNTAKLGIHIDNASGTPILEFGTGGATGGRITTNQATPIIIAPNNVERLRIDQNGQILPGADDAQNLGSSTKRWKNIYAADMHFSNEGKTNDVDGTWGDWTLQAG